MWKRERMMVDVISLQKPEDHSNSLQNSPLMPKLTNTNDSLPITQNRHYYAFQGLHDRQTRFYPGYEYDVFGVEPIDDDKRTKRPLNVDDDDESNDNKKQKVSQPTPNPPSFAFSSKPYDAMDNLMYFY